MMNTIPDFLKEKLNQKGFPQTAKFPDDIKKFMIEYADNYKWGITDLKDIFKIMKSNFTDLPICEYNGCDKPVKFNWELKLTRGCCQKHSTAITLLETHGVEHIAQITSIKEKMKNTCIERYGVCNPSKVKEFREKAENTMMTKYGYSNPSTDPKIKEQKIETCLKHYGVQFPAQSSIVREKAIQTKLKKYGYTHHFHDSTIFNKLMQSQFKCKEYIWANGSISLVQGNEPIVLKELENMGYTFELVLTDAVDMPLIEYVFEETIHRYYPDIYIPLENKIIEVKSDYTLKADWDKNQAKFEAVRNLGFDFQLEVR